MLVGLIEEKLFESKTPLMFSKKLSLPLKTFKYLDPWEFLQQKSCSDSELPNLEQQREVYQGKGWLQQIERKRETKTQEMQTCGHSWIICKEMIFRSDIYDVSKTVRFGFLRMEMCFAIDDCTLYSNHL